MILDRSAIIGILFQEPDFEILVEKVGQSNNVSIGAPTLVETSIVLSARLKRDARGLISRFIVEGEIAVIPFGDAHYATAVHAWLQYGKGRHPAGLNFGDCLSYATARIAGQPLLCVGNDFARTDIELI